MAAVFGKEELNSLDWVSRSDFGIMTMPYWYMSDIDNMLADLEESLAKTPIGGTGFVSQKEGELSESLSMYQTLLDYIDYLPYDINDLVDHPFHLQVNNEALEYLATIDATKLSTDNTIGLTGTQTTRGGGYSYTYETQLDSLCLGDFLGYGTTDSVNSYGSVEHDQYVSSFANLFEAQYQNLADEFGDMPLEDFLKSLLPGEFSVQKDVGFWRELGQGLMDLTIIGPLIESCTGVTIVTHDHLTQNERTWKAATAVIQAISVAITLGGSLALTQSGTIAAKTAGKTLAAAFISDIASTTVAVAGNRAGLPPALTALLAISAGVAAGRISTDLLFGDGKISYKKLEELIATDPGNRPDPSTYLNQNYIDAHLGQFDDGMVKFISGTRGTTVGAPESVTYVMPAALADDLIRQSNGDVRVLEQLLGMNPGGLGTNPLLVTFPEYSVPKISSGNEPGSNNYWLPGGYTSGGIPEAVVESVPIVDCIIESIWP